MSLGPFLTKNFFFGAFNAQNCRTSVGEEEGRCPLPQTPPLLRLNASPAEGSKVSSAPMTSSRRPYHGRMLHSAACSARGAFQQCIGRGGYPPPLLQGAQPMPSHRVLDGKCQLSRHL